MRVREGNESSSSKRFATILNCCCSCSLSQLQKSKSGRLYNQLEQKRSFL